jgi:hypothetical protein
LIRINGVVSMQDRPYGESDDQSVGTASEEATWPAGHWNLKDPRSCLEPDSCDCYVNPCVHSGVFPEGGCIDADILCGG